MGQKVNPIGLRLGINRNWESRWFPNFKTAPESLGEDHKIRTYLKKSFTMLVYLTSSLKEL